MRYMFQHFMPQGLFQQTIPVWCCTSGVVTASHCKRMLPGKSTRKSESTIIPINAWCQLLNCAVLPQLLQPCALNRTKMYVSYFILDYYLLQLLCWLLPYSLLLFSDRCFWNTRIFVCTLFQADVKSLPHSKDIHREKTVVYMRRHLHSLDTSSHDVCVHI